MAGAKKTPISTSFSPVTSTNVGISPPKFLTFSSIHFFHSGVKFQGHSQYQSQITELEPRSPLKELGFSGQILVKLRS